MQKLNRSLLKTKNPTTGAFEDFPVVVGKSAYDTAREGGYQGTEEEFARLLATVASLEARIASLEASARTVTPSTDEDGTLIF